MAVVVPVAESSFVGEGDQTLSAVLLEIELLPDAVECERLMVATALLDVLNWACVVRGEEKPDAAVGFPTLGTPLRLTVSCAHGYEQTKS